MPDLMIEDKYKNAFTQWTLNPSRANMGILLKAVQPEINRGLSAFVKHPNPVIKSKARKMALNALKSYDPSRAKLGTHIVNHLQGLRRQSRKQLNILSIPERVMLDQGQLEQTRVELEDHLGRPPSTVELADKSGLSVKRINHLRKFQFPIAEGSITSRNPMNPEAGGFLPTVEHESPAWTEMVYSSMDGTNQKIMEWTLGMHGEPQLSNAEIANKLRLSPGAISQRKQVIQSELDRQQELSPF